MDTCYRHPDRQTGVHCSNCGRPICPDCMTATPVGMRCPDCASNRAVRSAAFARPGVPYLTYMLITANVGLYLLTSANPIGFSANLNELGRSLALLERARKRAADVVAEQSDDERPPACPRPHGCSSPCVSVVR